MRPMPVGATKGCASCPLYEKGWRRGVGRQRNRLVDNELTRQTPAPNLLANLAQGGLGASLIYTSPQGLIPLALTPIRSGEAAGGPTSRNPGFSGDFPLPRRVFMPPSRLV